MKLQQLEIADVRSIRQASVEPGDGLNLLVGGNGAGKTSVLEALHLLAYGRSFRGRVRDGLIRTGAPALQVFARWTEQDSSRRRQVGLRHAGNEWEGRLDGADVGQLSELCTALAAVTFEPGSHALLSGGGEPRRRLLDWGLFHVEPGFMPVWRRHARALKQRNALLKSGGALAALDAWDGELAAAGELLDRHRRAYVEALEPQVEHWAKELLPELGPAHHAYVPGWRREDLALADALLVSRERDLQLGYTTIGPHRADLQLGFAARPGHEALSRGQSKLAALALLLAQAEDFRARRGEWPLILLDDLASELDRQHRHALLSALVASGAQVFITGTELEALALDPAWPSTVFHVEHGLCGRLDSSSER
ncbi:DNA replication/repair protein RecF [Solilutibacter silvestris]|uniref:DNA replication and repair protein RecF n=1 Tax=Solilutibacter silvestris TaxID=1645665 RepID=A0A2K1Q148_9GAMM|nr:DNA replication/repair protein RecF [Lysobacter silvestris]PNS08760.1 recf: DNA replication and repair protein RecF [Lysobacter silvestris]